MTEPALNQCANCDDWYLETEDNPGCLCLHCRELLKENESQLKAKNFFEEIQKM